MEDSIDKRWLKEYQKSLTSLYSFYNGEIEEVGYEKIYLAGYLKTIELLLEIQKMKEGR